MTLQSAGSKVCRNVRGTKTPEDQEKSSDGWRHFVRQNVTSSNLQIKRLRRKKFFAKENHGTQSSCDGESRSDLWYIVPGIKGKHVIDEKAMINIFLWRPSRIVAGWLCAQALTTHFALMHRKMTLVVDGQQIACGHSHGILVMLFSESSGKTFLKRWDCGDKEYLFE